MRRALLLNSLAALAVATSAFAQARKPPLPPGRDMGGVAVALIATGIDYTLPHIAGRLARDGEGELIGFDLVDNDNRPFAAEGAQMPANLGGNATTLAAAIVDQSITARLVPVRVDPGNGTSLARAVAFIAQTPARVVVVPMWGPGRELWQPFRQAAERSPQILFVAAAGDEAEDIDEAPAYPAALGLPNLLVVAAATRVAEGQAGIRLSSSANWGAKTVDAVALAASSALATAIAARSAAALQAQEPKLAGAALKERLLQLMLIARGGEIPQRTRTLAVIMPPPVLKPPIGGPDPAARILDKGRVPERLMEQDRKAR